MNSLTFCLRRYWLNFYITQETDCGCHPDNKEQRGDLGFKDLKSVPFFVGNVEKVSLHACLISYLQSDCSS